METVQLRMEVSKVTSANVSYLSKRLGLSKKRTYALIVDLFLFERDLDKAFRNLRQMLKMSPTAPADAEPDDLPF